MSKLSKPLDHESAFALVEKTVHKAAWKTHYRTGIDFNLCKSEAYYLFMTALESYDPSCGALFNTWVTRHLEWKMLDFARKQQCASKRESELTEEIVNVVPAANTGARSDALSGISLMEELSDDAKEIIALLIETPREILYFYKPRTPDKILQAVKKYLELRGKKRADLNMAEMEIRAQFHNIQRHLGWI